MQRHIITALPACVVRLDYPFPIHRLCPSVGSAAPCTDQLRAAPPLLLILLPLLLPSPPPLSQSAAAKVLQEPAGLNKLTQSVAFSLFNYRQLTALIISWLVEKDKCYFHAIGRDDLFINKYAKY